MTVLSLHHRQDDGIGESILHMKKEAMAHKDHEVKLNGGGDGSSAAGTPSCLRSRDTRVVLNKKSRNLSWFSRRLLVCFFQAQMFLISNPSTLLVSADPAPVVPNDAGTVDNAALDHGDIIMVSACFCMAVYFVLRFVLH